MTIANDAADAIRRAARLLEAFKIAADILDRIGSLENAEAEAQKAISVANAEAELARARVDELKGEAVKIEQQYAEIIQDARATAARIADESDAAARDTLSAAAARAKEVFSQAESESARRLEIIAANVDLMQHIKADIEAETLELQNRAAGARAEADEATTRLEAVRASIAKLASA